MKLRAIISTAIAAAGLCSLWIDCSYAAYCATNALASSPSDSSVDTHR